MHAGPEIGVAATKSFTSQLTIVTLLALLLGRIHYLSYAEGLDIISQIEKLPEKVAKALELKDQLAAIARKYSHAKNFLFMGRQANYPIALEGALKLKEVSYIAASGYPVPSLNTASSLLLTRRRPQSSSRRAMQSLRRT